MVGGSIKTFSPEDVTVIQANQFPIKSVKLFSSGSAEVTRTFALSSVRSQDEPQIIEIVHLPSDLQSVDLSITSASGGMTILDHYHIDNRTHLTSQTLHELDAERLRLQDEKRLRQQGFTFLTTYMDSLAQCRSNNRAEAAQMISFFDEFVEIGASRSAMIAELDGKLAFVKGRIREETDRLSKLGNDLPVKVVTVLLCNGQVPMEAPELILTYVVKQVSWKPSYDLHISMTGDTPSPTVTLDFRCRVTQWTGENWENISLILTTANQVSQLIQLPEPKRIDISLSPTPTSQRGGAASTSLSGTAPPRTSDFAFLTPMMGHARQPPSLLTLPPRAPVQVPYEELAATGNQLVTPGNSDEVAPKLIEPSQTISELISHDGKDPIVHITSGCIYIPSDHAAHRVLVASLSLQAEFMRVVVPSIDTRVYYTCEVKNTSEYVLLPGTVKAYLNGKHVSSAEIQSTKLPQILECSLAVDTGMKTMHNRAPDALPSVGAFTGKATTTYTSATLLQNTHPEPVKGVVVRSSIPLPADPRVTILLKEPAGLAEIDEGSVIVKEGCLARWSTTGGRKGKQAGLFEWVCAVNPGTEVLKAVWEVCAPQDLKLFEQLRS